MTATGIIDDDYVLEEGAAWLEVKGFAIRIHSTDEGVVVDIFKKDEGIEDLGEPLATTYAYDHECVEDYELMLKEVEDTHRVGCYFCWTLLDERDGMPNTKEYGGNDKGGVICPECIKGACKSCGSVEPLSFKGVYCCCWQKYQDELTIGKV